MKMFSWLFSWLFSFVTETRSRMGLIGAALAAMVVTAFPMAALATETETETKVKEVATQVGSEGVVIVLAILSALIALLVAMIVIPKAVALIKRFV